MSDKKDEISAVLSMTSETVGRDILSALVQEIKLLPKPWVSLSEAKQNDVLDRLRKRVDDNVRMAVHLISSEGRTVVAGDLDQITIKDGVKAVIKFSSATPNLHELYESGGKAVLVVVANPGQYTGGMNDVAGESDQRAMDLGHEYDQNGDGKGMDDDSSTLDGEGLIAIEDKPLQVDLDAAFSDGYEAAKAGQEQSTCPIMKGVLCIEWVKGWKLYQEENNTEWWQAHGEDVGDQPSPTKAWPFPTRTKKLGIHKNEHGVYVAEPDEELRWSDKKDYVVVQLLELENGVWLWKEERKLGSSSSSGPFTMRDSASSRAEALSKAETMLTKSDIGSKLKGKALAEFNEFLDSLLDTGNDDQQAA